MTKSGFDLDEIERLLAAATPGEWQHHCSHVYGPDPDRQLVCQFRNAPWLVSDRDLIVALHNSAPAMIAAIRELRAENARLKGDGGFLLARLGDLEWHDGAFEQTAREYFGHVEPAIERFRAALGEPQ